MKKHLVVLSACLIGFCSFNAPNKTIILNKQQTNMENKNFTTSILVDQTPQEVFNAINNVRGWWSANISGSTEALNDEFIYQYKEVHSCKMKLVESVAGKKVVWLVLENQFNFTEDKNEWKGNHLVFEISEKDGKTQLVFTQIGLVPEYECYEVCRDAWTSYIQGSLKNLITTGKGNPNTKENDLNKTLIEKWGLPDKRNFSYHFRTSKPANEVFALLLNIEQWWSGLYEESIEGKSKNLNDEFSFKAGGGVHYSKQKLVEFIPGKKIVWLVTDSNLNFLKHTDEWNGTKIRFDLSTDKNKTVVTFTHEGLLPQIECYESCSSAWTGYLNKLEKKLN